jgi:hypothetical protein
VYAKVAQRRRILADLAFRAPWPSAARYARAFQLCADWSLQAVDTGCVWTCAPVRPTCGIVRLGVVLAPSFLHWYGGQSVRKMTLLVWRGAIPARGAGFRVAVATGGAKTRPCAASPITVFLDHRTTLGASLRFVRSRCSARNHLGSAGMKGRKLGARKSMLSCGQRSSPRNERAAEKCRSARARPCTFNPQSVPANSF